MNIEHTNTRGTTTQQFAAASGTAVDTHAYGIAQYLIYDINPCWSGGLRVEWLFDTLALNDSFLDQRVESGVDAYALTWGLQWRPTANVTVRPELRWDWADERLYDDRSDYDQLLLGFDVLWTF